MRGLGKHEQKRQKHKQCKKQTFSHSFTLCGGGDDTRLRRRNGIDLPTAKVTRRTNAGGDPGFFCALAPDGPEHRDRLLLRLQANQSCTLRQNCTR